MPLFVYKSSAGSGKTTTLVNEYLNITLSDPNAFRYVLAITFTNKAAGEMKERVLKALTKIIAGQPLDKGEYAGLFRRVGVSSEEFVKRAQRLQSLILHHYDDFSISTIDSFVHGIIRTFATDVQLPQNFEVVIDKEEFVPDIVSELFAKVGADTALTDIMVNFVLSQADDEKTYNITRELNKFVEKQIGEEGFRHLRKIDHLTTADFVAVIGKLNTKRNETAAIIRKAGRQALDLIHSQGLSGEVFYYSTTGIYGFFEKSSTLTSDDHLPPKARPLTTVKEDKWTSGKASISDKEKIASIKDELIEKFYLISKVAQTYLRLNLIHKKIYALALTHEIRAIFNDYTERTQKVHISEFNKRISNEIAGQPVPFIYERLGRKYRYFLIDEFQDTSVLQWQNLLPLIEESLAYNNFNMLVGDAKQAIYRFRSGEVELFVNLPALFQNDGSPLMAETEQMLKSHYREVQLNENWRSAYEIVQFNNAFFQAINQKQSEHIQSIYAGHHQQMPEGKPKSGGYVAIELIEAETKEDYSALRLEKIVSQVDQLTARGYRMKDICVLTRTNKYAVEVASWLIEHNYPVVSSESLLLSNAPGVRLITAFYNLLIYPGESLYLAEFITGLLMTRGEGDFHSTFTRANAVLHKGLDEVFVALEIPVRQNEVMELPVYEMAEYLIRKLALNQTSNIYLQYFLDFVFEAQQQGHASPAPFIEQWELKKNKAFITMPGGVDSIQVMTVHKAKGLKFEAVIVDLIKRGNKKGRDEYWTDLQEEGLEELKVTMLPISAALERVGLESVYNTEKDKTELDFLNLVYVAFTRPVSALFINGHVKSESASDAFTKYLLQFLENGQNFETGKALYEFGTLATFGPEQYRGEEAGEQTLTRLTSTAWHDQIHSAPADEVYWEAINSKPARTYGKLIHAMLAKIHSVDHIDRVIAEFRAAGLIDPKEAGEIEALLNRLLALPQLKPYYAKGLQARNEADLIAGSDNGKSVLRPDRVIFNNDEAIVIDYKTGASEEKHRQQIGRYAGAIQNLGYSKVQKILVYLNDEIEVVEVD